MTDFWKFHDRNFRYDYLMVLKNIQWDFSSIHTVCATCEMFPSLTTENIDLHKQTVQI